MNAFDLVGASAPRQLPKWMPPIGGLIAAVLVACLVCRLPLVHTLSWGELIGSSVECVLAVFLAGAVGTWGLCAARTGTRETATWRTILGTSLDALWLAPLALFIRESSTWGMAVAVVLVASLARSFYFLRDRDEPGDTGESILLLSRCEFTLSDSSPWFWRQTRAAGAALCAQTGALAGLAGYPFAGAAMVGISSAIWTWSFMRYASLDNAQSSASSQSASRSVLLLVLAIAFTAGGLIQYLPNTYWAIGFGVPSRQHWRHRLTPVDQSARPEGEKPSESGDRRGQPRREKTSEDGDWRNQPLENTSEGLFRNARDANSGVILWPAEAKLTKLIAPAPAMGNGLLKSNRMANPLVIPFNGVYWFFKAPDLHPPVTSRQAHGSPDALDIHSTDRRPLSMEAHENLGSMIDLDCCSRIQISIRNADRYPETVSMELILVNSSLSEKPSESLGTITVKSTPSWSLYGGQSLAHETLNFSIPPHHSLRRFDEMKIVFRLDAFRADDGAKIAIDHFVLIPRGL